MADEQFIRDLYQGLLGRSPGSNELEQWLLSNASDKELFYEFFRAPETMQRLRVKFEFAPGHYYSPIVDPEEARRFLRRDKFKDPNTLPGIEISLERMTNFWKSHTHLMNFDFESAPRGSKRFQVENPSIPLADAFLYRLLLLAHKPNTVIEIGSGMSTGLALDTIEEGELNTKITCVEPYPAYLNTILRPNDHERITLVESPVQAVSLSVFASLRAGDMLFIDSTHVLKTASDVHYELFEILPVLPEGTIVHFHDIEYPFEYPDEWVFERNFSWNEAYALRAYLMYNNHYQIEFWNDLFVHQRQELIRRTVKCDSSRYHGGSLWLRKTKPG